MANMQSIVENDTQNINKAGSDIKPYPLSSSDVAKQTQPKNITTQDETVDNTDTSINLQNTQQATQKQELSEQDKIDIQKEQQGELAQSNDNLNKPELTWDNARDDQKLFFSVEKGGHSYYDYYINDGDELKIVRINSSDPKVVGRRIALSKARSKDEADEIWFASYFDDKNSTYLPYPYKRNDMLTFVKGSANTVSEWVEGVNRMAVDNARYFATKSIEKLYNELTDVSKSPDYSYMLLQTPKTLATIAGMSEEDKQAFFSAALDRYIKGLEDQSKNYSKTSIAIERYKAELMKNIPDPVQYLQDLENGVDFSDKKFKEFIESDEVKKYLNPQEIKDSEAITKAFKENPYIAEKMERIKIGSKKINEMYDTAREFIGTNYDPRFDSELVYKAGGLSASYAVTAASIMTHGIFPSAVLFAGASYKETMDKAIEKGLPIGTSLLAADINAVKEAVTEQLQLKFFRANFSTINELISKEMFNVVFENALQEGVQDFMQKGIEQIFGIDQFTFEDYLTDFIINAGIGAIMSVPMGAVVQYNKVKYIRSLKKSLPKGISEKQVISIAEHIIDLGNKIMSTKAGSESFIDVIDSALKIGISENLKSKTGKNYNTAALDKMIDSTYKYLTSNMSLEEKEKFRKDFDDATEFTKKYLVETVGMFDSEAKELSKGLNKLYTTLQLLTGMSRRQIAEKFLPNTVNMMALSAISDYKYAKNKKDFIKFESGILKTIFRTLGPIQHLTDTDFLNMAKDVLNGTPIEQVANKYKVLYDKSKYDTIRSTVLINKVNFPALSIMLENSNINNKELTSALNDLAKTNPANRELYNTKANDFYNMLNKALNSGSTGGALFGNNQEVTNPVEAFNTLFLNKPISGVDIHEYGHFFDMVYYANQMSAKLGLPTTAFNVKIMNLYNALGKKITGNKDFVYNPYNYSDTDQIKVAEALPNIMAEYLIDGKEYDKDSAELIKYISSLYKYINSTTTPKSEYADTKEAKELVREIQKQEKEDSLSIAIEKLLKLADTGDFNNQDIYNIVKDLKLNEALKLALYIEKGQHPVVTLIQAINDINNTRVDSMYRKSIDYNSDIVVNEKSNTQRITQENIHEIPEAKYENNKGDSLKNGEERTNRIEIFQSFENSFSRITDIVYSHEFKQNSGKYAMNSSSERKNPSYITDNVEFQTEEEKELVSNSKAIRIKKITVIENTMNRANIKGQYAVLDCTLYTEGGPIDTTIIVKPKQSLFEKINEDINNIKNGDIIPDKYMLTPSEEELNKPLEFEHTTLQKGIAQFKNDSIGSGIGETAHGPGTYFTLTKDGKYKFIDQLSEPMTNIYYDNKRIRRHTPMYNFLYPLSNEVKMGTDIKQAIQKTLDGLIKVRESYQKAYDIANNWLLGKYSLDMMEKYLNDNMSDSPEILKALALIKNKFGKENNINIAIYNTLQEFKQRLSDYDEKIKFLNNIDISKLKFETKKGKPIVYKASGPTLNEMLNQDDTRQSKFVNEALDKLLQENNLKDKVNIENKGGLEIFNAIAKALGSEEKARFLLDSYGIKGLYYEGDLEGLSAVIYNPEKSMKILSSFNGSNITKNQLSNMYFEKVDNNQKDTANTEEEQNLNLSVSEIMGDNFSRAFTVVSERLKKDSPKLFAHSRSAMFKSMQDVKRYKQQAKDLVIEINKMSPEDKLAFKKAWNNRDFAGLINIADKYDIRQNLVAIRATLNELHQIVASSFEGESYNQLLGYLQDYFPRLVIDHDGLASYLVAKNSDKGAVKTDTSETANNKFDKWMDKVKNWLEDDLNYSKKKVGSAYFYKQRQIEIVDDEMLKFYAEPTDAFDNYINKVQDILFRKYFFGDGYVKEFMNSADTGKKITSINGIDYVIPNWKKRVKDMGFLTGDKATDKRILDAIESVFFRGDTGSFGAIYRTATNILTINSFFSALSNLGDLALTLYNYGLKNTMSAIKDVALKDAQVTTEDLGIEDLYEEFKADGTKLKKVFNAVMKWSGFKYLDIFTKDVNIQAALLNAKETLKSSGEKTDALIDKIYMYMGGDEEAANALIANLINDNWKDQDVRLFAFNELSNQQPITKLEVPEFYNKYPQFRVLYLYKTFAVKQLNFAYANILSDIKNNPKQGFKKLVKFMAWLMAVGVTKDIIADMLKGKEIHLTDSAMFSITSFFFLNEYNYYTFKNKGAIMGVFHMVMPPVPLMTEISSDVKRASKGKIKNPMQLKTIRGVPVIGKPFQYWFGD